MSTSKQFEQDIANIPGGDGFYKSSAEKTFLSAGRQLVENGFSEEHAIDFLNELYRATASCYGD